MSRELLFPRFSPTGAELAGGNERISVGDATHPPDSYADLGPGRSVAWGDPGLLLFLAREGDGRGFYYATHDPDGVWRVSSLQRDDLGCNAVDARGGWAVLVTSIDGTPSLVTLDGRTYSGYTGAAIDATGCVIAQTWQEGHAVQLFRGGASVLLDTAGCADVCAASKAQAWTARLGSAWEVHGVRSGEGVRVLSTPGRHEAVIALVDTPEGEFVLARGGVDSNQLVLYPWGSRQGYAVADPTVETYYPGLGYDRAADELLVAWTRSGDGACTVWRMARSAPRIDVDRLPTPEPPDPEPPDPEPEPPEPPMAKPKITITEYAAGPGAAPFKCRAVWGKEAGSGPVSQIEWQYKADGAKSWIVAARNDANDPDHTYTFDAPGTWLIAAKAYGAGGTHQTGARRAVTVTAPAPEPEPPQPQPEPPENIAIRTVNGFFFCAEDGGGREVNATRGGVPGIWESFFLEPQPDGSVALRALNGQYLSADTNVGQLMADRSSVGDWERFTISTDHDDVVTIKSVNGYLWAENAGGGAVHVNGDRIDDWSTFTIQAGSPDAVLPDDAPVPSPGGKPTREAALKVRAAFLEAPGYEMSFMFPGWDQGKQDAYLAWMKERKQTHLFFSAWGAYGSHPAFDFTSDEDWPKFLALVDRVQAQGFVVVYFCITDQVWGGDGFDEDWAHDWIRRRVPDLVPRVRMFVNGWEWPQINSGYDNWWTWNGDANHRILHTIREVVGPDNYVMCHFPPERLTGWPHYQHEGGGGEPDWWQVAGGDLDGILWQDGPDKEEWLVVSDCIGGPSADGSTDIGDCNRIVGNPSTWDLRDKVFIAFEYSRECDRSERLAKEFSVEPKVSGWGNMGHWNGE